MLSWTRPFFVAALIAFAIAICPSSAPLASPDAARAFITALGNESVAVLQSAQPSTEKASKLEDIFRRAFDFPTIGRFVLGRHWNTATPAQREEFLKVFTEFVTRSYARRLSDETVSGFSITNVRDLGNGEVLVQTGITRPNGPRLTYDWRVRNSGNNQHIVDVIVEGVSLLVTHRNDFSSVAQREGVNGLIASLRQKLAQQ